MGESKFMSFAKRAVRAVPVALVLGAIAYAATRVTGGEGSMPLVGGIGVAIAAVGWFAFPHRR